MKPYTAADIAEKLGESVTTFYRTRERWHTEDKLPRPLSEHRPLKFERRSIDAWFLRYFPCAAPLAAANDPLPPLPPTTIEEHQLRFAREYGGAT